MPIQTIITSQSGLVGTLPSLAYINTNDTVSTVTMTGYLTAEVNAGAIFTMPCMALVSTQTTLRAAQDVGWYEVQRVGAEWSLIPVTGGGGGTVNPGSINQLAWYAANGATVSGLSTANNGVLVTSSGGVPSISTTLPTGLTIPSATITSSTAALTAGSVIAAPVAGTDLVNKTYADGLVSAANSYKYWVSTSTPALANSVNLGALTSGLLKISVSTGTAIPATAVDGTDYWAPGDVIVLPGPPTMGSDAATKAYVDAAVSGNNYLPAVVCSTTANLSATYNNGTAGVGATLTATGNGAFSTDGISPTLNSRILVAFETSAAYNGIYTLTTVGDGSHPYVLTRATNYDTAAQINPGDTVLVETGTLYAGTLWFQSAVVTTIGTDPIVFTELAFITIPISLANGGTGVSLMPSNGGIVYSNSSTLAILAGTATAYQMLQSGSSTAPAWSTSTWPATTTANQLLYSSSANTVAGLTTADNGVLITSSSGVPSWLANSGTPGYVLTANSGAPPSWQNIQADGAVTEIAADSGSATPTTGTITVSGGSTGLTTSGSGSTIDLTGTLAILHGGTGITSFGTGVQTALGQNVTGSGGMVLANSPTITTPVIAEIKDANGNVQLDFYAASSAVNYISMSNSPTGVACGIVASGTDTNITLQLNGKGNAGVVESGATNGSFAPAGYKGEVINVNVPSGSPVTFSSSTPKTLTSISLTAGNWMITGNLSATFNTTGNAVLCGISLTSNLLPDQSLLSVIFNTSNYLNTNIGVVAPTRIISITSTTTFYLVGQLNSATGNSIAVCGNLNAVRI